MISNVLTDHMTSEGTTKLTNTIDVQMLMRDVPGTIGMKDLSDPNSTIPTRDLTEKTDPLVHSRIGLMFPMNTLMLCLTTLIGVSSILKEIATFRQETDRWFLPILRNQDCQLTLIRDKERFQEKNKLNEWLLKCHLEKVNEILEKDIVGI